MSLPLIRTGIQSLDLLQSKWKAELDPKLGNVLANGLLISNVSLSIGDNVINHKLGRVQQGWILVDQNAGATIYRSAALNDSTLTLNSSAGVTISLWVF